MKIPEQFKKQQAEVFQDRQVSHHLPAVSVGVLGTETVTPGVLQGVYNVNFRVLTDALQAQEYGLVVNRDAIVKTSFPFDAKEGDFLKYRSVFYRIVGTQPTDAYTAYLLKAVDDGD